MIPNKFRFLAALAVLALAALSCRLAGGSPKLENLRLASDQDGQQVTTSFPQDGTFYLVGDMTGLLLDKAMVKATWTAVDVDGGEKNKLIEEKDQQISNGAFWFNLYKNEGKWPAGKYKVDVAVNDKLVQTLEFQVEPGPTTVTNLQTTKDQEGSTPTTTYAPADDFYVTFDMENPRPDTTLKAVWTAVDVPGIDPNTPVKEQEETSFDGSGGYYLKLSRTEGAWLPGKYSVAISLNGAPVTELAFEVVGELSASSPAAGAISAPYLASDEAGDVKTSSFSQDSEFYAHFQVAEAPDSGLPFKGILKTVAVEGEQPGTEVNTVTGTATTGAAWINFYNARPWPIGTYQIELYANDQLAQTLDLAVVSTNTSGATIEKAYSSTDEAGAQPADSFGLNGPIYIQAKLADAPDDTQVRAVLVAVDVQGEDPYTFVADASQNFGSGEIYFTFTNKGDWPAGKYVVYLYLNGEEAGSVELTVQ